MNMNNIDMFAEAARDVLVDQCTPQVVRVIEAEGCNAPAAEALWAHLEATGLADAMLSEEQGGAGLEFGQTFGLLEQCGAHALPLPLGESMVARSLLAQAKQVRPPGSIVLARGQVLSDGGVYCAMVRSAQVAHSVLVETASDCRLLTVQGAHSAAQASAQDAVLTWSREQVQAAPVVAVTDAVDLRTLQAAVVAAQMAGALGSVFQRTLQYANERQQFGRPIGKFQAIQHQLAVMSEHVFAARMAAQLGCSSVGLQLDRLRVATAKARCSEAALAVAEFAHAIHGAIGFTQEYDLQLYTRRLHGWRQTAGSEAYWQRVAGEALMQHPGLTLDLVRRVTDL